MIFAFFRQEALGRFLCLFRKSFDFIWAKLFGGLRSVAKRSVAP